MSGQGRGAVGRSRATNVSSPALSRFFLLSFFAIVCLCWIQHAAADPLHYIKATQVIRLMDNTAIPVGGELEVKYDNGDSWIPYFTTTIPSIPKKLAVHIDEVLFNPPIEGKINDLTSLYERWRIGNTIGSHLLPNSTGKVLAKGTPVKISERLGDFYIVSSKKLFIGIVPVSAVSVQDADLSSGQTLTVPPVPAPDPAPASSATSPAAIPRAARPPQPGPLFGRLKVPYTLRGKPLSVGSYVVLENDAGDEWVLGEGMSLKPPRISKDAVDVIDKFRFYSPLTGRITSPTPVYQNLPDTTKNPTTLEQSEIFAGMNPTVHVGDQIYITAREGSDYVIQIAQHGVFNSLGRVPVTAVSIIAGDPNNGTQIQVPPEPQNTDANAPGYVPPPPKDYTATYAIGIGAVVVISIIGGAIYRLILSTPPTLDPEIWAKIDRRFPPNRIFRVSHEVRNYFGYRKDNVPPIYEEYNVEYWEKIITKYPNEPVTEQDRINGEVRFWFHYANLFTVTLPNGSLSLLNKQKIIQHFEYWEKWILREYYAATGIIIESYVVRISEVAKDIIKARAVSTVGASEGDKAKRIANIERYQESMKNLDRDFGKAHIDKWGDWFFYHVETAFKTLQESKTAASRSPPAPANNSNDDETRYDPKI